MLDITGNTNADSVSVKTIPLIVTCPFYSQTT